MELYIIRHGETVWNKEQRLQGRTDIELSSYGRELAGNLGEKLDDTDFDIIFSSPLIRAYETASLIRGHRNIEIRRDKRLEEISFGVEEGTDYNTWNVPGSKYYPFFVKPEDYTPPEKGETIEELCKRTEDFVKSEIEKLYGQCDRVMIVAHGALNKSMMCYLEGHGIEDFWKGGLQKNCEATVFEYDGKSWSMQSEEKKATPVSSWV